MAFSAFAAPILPGKRAQWDRFIVEITGPRRDEFNASRARNGIHERTFLQETPVGDVVIVTLEGDDPLAGMGAMANTDDDLTRWFVQQVQEIYGFDLRQPPQYPPRLIIDSSTTSTEAGVGGTAGASGATWAQIIKVRVEEGKEEEVLRVLSDMAEYEQPDSGLLRSLAMRDQRDPNTLYTLIECESEEKARARENDPRRLPGLKVSQAKLGDLLDGPPEFVDLDIVYEAAAPTPRELSSTAQGAVLVLRRIVEEIINGRDMTVFDDLFAPDFVEHEALPNMPQGRDGTRLLFTMLHTGFPDLHVAIDDVVAQGDKAVFRMTWKGTHTGEFMGIPPTGRTVMFSVYDIVRVEDGKAVEHWGLLDQLSLLQQLGVAVEERARA